MTARRWHRQSGVRLSSMKLHSGRLQVLQERIVGCQRCERLRRHCRDAAQTRRAAYRDWQYWGKPVPGFGDPNARLWIIGLAPGAHGANRTGRVFTGDRSGDFLYAALHRAGFANKPLSISRDDGLVLRDCYISAAARCAPPQNKPSPGELEACRVFLDEEWTLLHRKRVILALGRIAWQAALRLAQRQAKAARSSVTGADFAHGAVGPLSAGVVLIGSYHVSQQNTFTGRLTAEMFDAVLRECKLRFDPGGLTLPGRDCSPGS